eukprot:TRINITY_DN4104_c0_g1_i2.p2 TRINITY_DN4104_c0_g1~~TRINITY_DN4104_c0_g1_i2.p2  ORF type:complete len:162 (-),score=23.61 TRINITY_DN4104_c0_g1_i2:81-566(-)
MFDMELLLKSYDCYAGDGDKDTDENKQQEVDISELIYSTGVVWLHSAEETSFGAFTPDQFTNEYGWKHYNQLQEIIAIHKSNYLDSNKCEKEWVDFIMKLSWKDYFQICQIVYLTGINVYEWSPALKDLTDMMPQKYPEKAPEWIQDPSKNKEKEKKKINK